MRVHQLSPENEFLMKSWFFSISRDEILAVAEDLLERHGEDAQDEALRLADVGRRIGSRRHSKIYRRAARHLAGKAAPAIDPQVRAWLDRIGDSVRAFGAPRVKAPEGGFGAPESRAVFR